MRCCAKLKCRTLAAATVILRYPDREVEIVDLSHEPDPNLVDLCTEHADRLTPPLGWAITDSRTRIPAAV